MSSARYSQYSRSFGIAFLTLSAAINAAPPSAPRSQWVYPDASGKLTYKTLEAGDRILDFSYAGYGGGGVAIPSLPVKATVAPSGGDDTPAIQAAIDKVSKLPLANGVRGSVVLAKGRFHCRATLKIEADGVVLHGSGMEEGGTVIEMTGDPHLAISIAGQNNIKADGPSTTISDAYVPSGSNSLNVRDSALFHVGDRVQITRPVTPEWLHQMGMDTLVRNGKKQTWIAGDLKTERTIAAINGKKLIFDVPLADSYDARYLGPNGASITRVEHTGQISQVGVENLRLVAPARSVTLNDKHFNGLQMNNVVDGWLRNLRIFDTTEAIGIGKDARRITVQQVDVTQSKSIVGNAKPADFSANGTQILFDRCSATGDSVFYIAVGPGMQGPNVVLHCIFHGNGHVQPHQRWSTGLLIDSCQVPEGGIDLMNRGSMGSGHGWTMGWGVLWNNVAKSYIVQMPPGAANWAIGNRGEQLLGKLPTFDPGPELPMLPQGIIDSEGTPVAPASLYLEQLKQRLGVQALRNIDY
ncbi:hypothetical protein [Terriglobus albidus]|uniref:hypothetical protein n=1 Tax=Terriglobus albidus TaxID=1592106 RepID=UPI0021DFD5A4|nr:hypothetical protein [Terriglobus albidus]